MCTRTALTRGRILEESRVVALVSLLYTCIKIPRFNICCIRVMYFVSIDAGAQVAIILLAYGPCVVIVNLLGQVCTLGRALRTKETLPDFRECCRVT